MNSKTSLYPHILKHVVESTIKRPYVEKVFDNYVCPSLNPDLIAVNGDLVDGSDMLISVKMLNL